MVTIKGGVLKGGTTKKKKHYMDDRKPQQMRVPEPAPSRVTGPPKKLEGALGPSKSTPSFSMPKAKSKAPSFSMPKVKPARTSKPMPASIPTAQGKATPRRNQVSISRETAVGAALGYLVSGPASRTDKDRKKRAKQIRGSYK